MDALSLSKVRTLFEFLQFSPTALSRPPSPSGCPVSLRPPVSLGPSWFWLFLRLPCFLWLWQFWAVLVSFLQNAPQLGCIFYLLTLRSCVLGRKTPAMLITSYQGPVLSTWLTRIAPLITWREMVFVDSSPFPFLCSCCTLWKIICLCDIIFKKSLLRWTCHPPSRNLVIIQACGFRARWVSGTELGCDRRLQSRRLEGVRLQAGKWSSPAEALLLPVGGDTHTRERGPA